MSEIPPAAQAALSVARQCGAVDAYGLLHDMPQWSYGRPEFHVTFRSLTVGLDSLVAAFGAVGGQGMLDFLDRMHASAVELLDRTTGLGRLT
ncbi:hypothetical protein GCM10022236_41530 [Microlunatus ginsengisoli]|uniref:Uncharacterized protein n=2 Tax=Microlunatus ginsengisoli TaxID=363863 RepID=A0ABP7AK61_9ACTN